jgi:calmodulin
MKMLGYNMSDDELNAIFNAVDEEGEGEILFNDFLTLMVVLMENDTEEQNLINAFDTLDVNNTGLISVEHVRRVLSTIGEQMTSTEIQSFIENSDLDDDGMVSINDIQRMLA